MIAPGCYPTDWHPNDWHPGDATARRRSVNPITPSHTIGGVAPISPF